MPNIIKNIGITPKATLIFFLLHIPIALLSKTSVAFSTFYAIFILLIACVTVLRKEFLFTACIIGYIVGAEVLWRMTGGNLIWEFGKYSISGIIILTMLFSGKKIKSAHYLILYFLLLVPSIWLISFDDFYWWRQIVSFNLSGPLSLCLCGLYFSRLTSNKRDLQRIFAWLIAPVISIAFLAMLSIKQTPAIRWGLYSVTEAAGGFGPNQVSSILGLGVFLCIVFCVLTKGSHNFRMIFIPLSIWLFSQAILTFSRGGVIDSVISTLIFLSFLMKKRKTRITALFLGLFLILISYSYLIPKLNQFTAGKLSERYTKRVMLKEIEFYDTGSRVDYIILDLRAFIESLPFGIGISVSPFYHEVVGGVPGGAHTEWTRMLAEHGVLGLFSLMFLLTWVVKSYKSIKDPIFKIMMLAFIAHAASYMMHSAMRLALPAFVIGFLGTNFKSSEEYKE